MPTGYTANVQDGTITELEPFLRQLARGFGFLIQMRDAPSGTPIPERFEPQTEFYDQQLATARQRMVELCSMTPEQVEAAAKAHAVQCAAEWEEREAARSVDAARYTAMLAKLEAWQPENEALQEMRTFGINQLRDSREHDCEGHESFKPKPMTAEEWFAASVDVAARDIARSMNLRREEIERTESRNAVLAAFLSELASLQSGAAS